SRRNQTAVSDAEAVPLTDVADLNNQVEETTKPLPMPEMQLQYDGHPETMRNLVVEPGAVPPPQEVIDQLNAREAARRARGAPAAGAIRLGHCIVSAIRRSCRSRRHRPLTGPPRPRSRRSAAAHGGADRALSADHGVPGARSRLHPAQTRKT